MTRAAAWLHAIVALLAGFAHAASPIDELYCGSDNCYGLLGVDRDADASVVKKSFRKLALKWHPDKNPDPGANARFTAISRASEVLLDPQLRQAYDYFLDNPGERYANFYRYYRAAYTPHTPIWAVVVGVLLFCSGVQYVNQHWRYASTRRCILLQPQFKRRVNELVDAELTGKRSKFRAPELDELRMRIEAQVLDSEVRVSGGALSRPCFTSLVIVSAVRLPYDAARAVLRLGRWHWRFSWNGEVYGQEERALLTMRALGLSADNWNFMEDAEREQAVARELWAAQNMRAYRAEKEEEMQQRLAQSGAYKRYKRWARKN